MFFHAHGVPTQPASGVFASLTTNRLLYVSVESGGHLGIGDSERRSLICHPAASIQSIIIVQPLTTRQENLRRDSYHSFRGFPVARALHSNYISLFSTAIDGDIAGVNFCVVRYRPLLIAPCQPLRLCAAIMFFESRERSGVLILASGLVAREEGRGRAGLESSGGGGSEAVGGVVKKEGE